MIGERGYMRRAGSVTDAIAQIEVESGKRPYAAAVNRFAALDKLAPTARDAETNEGKCNG
jgi:hypothetical protein